jgi:hypothetical protein
MTQPQTTILLPNYRTPDLTRLCLRLLRKHTDANRIRVIAIDNGSGEGDASLDYLRSVRWITLLERQVVPGQSPSASHAAALDLALKEVVTPFVLSIHTDTFVLRNDWLDYLLSFIEHEPKVAGVGSWKLEIKPLWKLALKRLEFSFQSKVFPLIGKELIKSGDGENYHYLRSHLALYRTDLLRRYDLGFGDGGDTAGKVMHRTLEQMGYRMIFLPPEHLSQYAVHLNHATMVLNPELGARTRTKRKGQRRIRKVLREMHAAEVLADESLDA